MLQQSTALLARDRRAFTASLREFCERKVKPYARDWDRDERFPMEVVKELGVKPVLRYVAAATAGVDPNYMGEGPIPATKKALARAGLRAPNVDLVELNEAFAAQSIACIRGLHLDPARVNTRGGAIALGHPIGASGARIVATLMHAMKSNDKARIGLATLCIGVGQGIATLFEKA